jgi:phosphoribosylformylglycinamidine cyclo-ligase
VLHKTYGARFHESYDTSLDEHVVYIGPHRMTDPVEIPGYPSPAAGPNPSGTAGVAGSRGGPVMDIGQLLLSPTRTYAPLLKQLLTQQFGQIHGLIHCSGGGQTKCMKYLPGNFKVIKDNLFEAPLIFKLIQQASGSDNREMYQVFNMGHRLEVFTSEAAAADMISVGQQFGIEAKIVGRLEAAEQKSLVLKVGEEEIIY